MFVVAVGLACDPCGATDRASVRLFADSQEHPDITKMTDEEVAAWRKEKQITVYGENIPKPVLTFAQSPFPGK